MRILLSLAVVIGTMAAMSASTEAQVYNDGYQWGAGVSQSLTTGHIPNRRFARRGFRGGFGFGPTPRFEDIPYFAKFPPVYYNGIVPRPYGISPFAAPAGIPPVELSYPQPLTIKNQFYQEEIAPVSDEQNKKPAARDSKSNKLTWQRNPYIESVAARN